MHARATCMNGARLGGQVLMESLVYSLFLKSVLEHGCFASPGYIPLSYKPLQFWRHFSKHISRRGYFCSVGLRSEQGGSETSGEVLTSLRSACKTARHTLNPKIAEMP